MNNFDYCIPHILEEEGGYTNNKRDPGGETKYGISKRSYPSLDIPALSENQAKSIYRRDYWDVNNLDSLSLPLALCVLDCAVNQGNAVAVPLLQRLVGAKDDGDIGPQTLQSIRQYVMRELVVNYMAERGVRYANTKNFETFGRGWMRRLLRIFYQSTKLT